jgi:hypothetical protein
MEGLSLISIIGEPNELGDAYQQNGSHALCARRLTIFDRVAMRV